MKITSNSRVTIPQNIRRYLGLHPGDEVEFVIDGNDVRIMPASTGQTRGERMVARLRGNGTVKMTTDEIMALTRGEGE